MISAFFIERPRFAIVISLVIVIAGLVSLAILPVDRFPDLTPPNVRVEATYAGASAEIVEQTVAAPLEQEINGVPNLLYMSSTCSSDGKLNLNVTFKVGTDVDIAAVQVQNRMQKAMPRIPEEVRRRGVTVEATSPNMVGVINLVSPNKTYDTLFLNNYMTLNIMDVVKRVPGIGRTFLFGARDYGMRVWLDPDHLRSFGLITDDVLRAIREQNLQIAGGRIGAAPVLDSQRFQYNVTLQGRLVSKKEFEDIIIRANPDGSLVRVKDVATVELGAENYDLSSYYDGGDTAMLAFYQAPGSNSMAVMDYTRKEMDRLSTAFPEDLKYEIAYDSTNVIKASIDEVVETLVIAVGLVVLIVLIFLANVRATLVPAIAVPVSLIGTFAMMMMIGFSLNLLTLFGLILAIGIVVDDAILVVETTMRNIEERGMDPKQATLSAMEEISGAVIASTLVLFAVFVPIAFMPGMTGRLYNQFALTIAGAVGISTINALTLSPALCSLLLKKTDPSKPSLMKRGFDFVFEPTRAGYTKLLRLSLRFRYVMLLAYGGLIFLTVWLFSTVPTGFLPNEDDGYFFINMQLPDAASVNRTGEAIHKVEGFLKEDPNIETVLSVAGYSLLSGASSPNAAMIIIVLKQWDQRPLPDQHVDAIMKRLQAKLVAMPEATAFAFLPPPIPGLGNSSGLDFELELRQGGNFSQLGELAQEAVIAARNMPAVAAVMATFRADVPRIYLDIDRDQARTMGVTVPMVANVLSASVGSMYVNDFTLFGRTYRVMMEAQRKYTGEPEDLLGLFVPNDKGQQVPVAAFAETQFQVGPDWVSRFNLYKNARLTVVPAPGFSTGQAMTAMDDVAQALFPPGVGYEWSGSARQSLEAQGAAGVIFGLAIVLVFLFLVAQYESFTIPIAVMIAVPVALMGAAAAQYLVGASIDLYTQVGLVLLIGLSAKTAILLVELSKQQREAGMSIMEAAVTAGNLRLRAVLMTALTFVFGMIPMLLSSGAGAASRVSLGVAVTGGMIVATIFILLWVPVFYMVVQTIRERVKGVSDDGSGSSATPPPIPPQTVSTAGEAL